MSLEALDVGIVEELQRRVLDGAVHPLGLAVCPGVIGLGQPVGDAVLGADAIEDMKTECLGSDRCGFWQVSEGNTVVGQHRVDLVGKASMTCAEKPRRSSCRPFVELDEGEFRDAIDGEEHVDLAIGMAQLAAVDVDVADCRLCEAAALRLGLIDRQSRNAVAFEGSGAGSIASASESVLQTSHDVVERQQGALPKATTMASSGGVSTVLLGSRGPIRKSAVVERDRHLLTVVRLSP